MKKLFLFGLVSVFVLTQNNFCLATDNTNETPKIERHFIFDSIPMNLEELTKAADRIFSGKCIKITEIENDEASKLPVYEYTFKIAEGLKGINSEEITFKQWQPTARNSGYDVGRKYIVFLYPDSERGLTSPVALPQGKFDIETTGIFRRRETVKNNLNNKGLSRNLKTHARVVIEKDKFINSYLDECSEDGAPIRYKEFIQAVRYLVEQ